MTLRRPPFLSVCLLASRPLCCFSFHLPRLKMRAQEGEKCHESWVIMIGPDLPCSSPSPPSIAQLDHLPIGQPYLLLPPWPPLLNPDRSQITVHNRVPLARHLPARRLELVLELARPEALVRLEARVTLAAGDELVLDSAGVRASTLEAGLDFDEGDDAVERERSRVGRWQTKTRKKTPIST